ncbi:MAG: FAD-linked oxidase C-terminal domain-containing protein [Nitriliruptorales bacterium]|nr:FAD-linked oxidase C-terminal domain-containing protein [Nitriliruptorales bacterium]
MTPPGLVEDLAARLPAAAVVTDADVVATHARDRADWVEAGTAAALVRARSTADVVATIEIARRHRTPVVPRGAGSGLSGGANAIDGCVLLALDQMSSVLDIDTSQRLARVQPGVLNGDLNRAVAQLGLWYPPDPSSRDISSIGGNVATNAGGLCCVKYGVTRDWIAGLEVVLADGRVIRTGSRTRKNVAGYDLTGLFVGSEGTLGVVTEVTVRLRRPPAPASTAVAFFGTLADAGRAVEAIMAAGEPSVLEVMDRPTVNAVEDMAAMDLDRDAAALLIGQADDDSPQQRAAAIAVMEDACRTAGATFLTATNDPDEGDQLLTARRLAGTALEAVGPIMREDVCVPVPALAAYLDGLPRIIEQTGIRIAAFGHAGDGNLHPTVLLDHDGDDGRARGEEAFDRLIRSALDHGGVITGEHGVGALKLPWLGDQVGDDVRDVNAGIKCALDPDGILNPGKAI